MRLLRSARNDISHLAALVILQTNV